ncbi:hypothetical protein ACMFMG_006071 [Clarireedia jacksonii]
MKFFTTADKYFPLIVMAFASFVDAQILSPDACRKQNANNVVTALYGTNATDPNSIAVIYQYDTCVSYQTLQKGLLNVTFCRDAHCVLYTDHSCTTELLLGVPWPFFAGTTFNDSEGLMAMFKENSIKCGPGMAPIG